MKFKHDEMVIVKTKRVHMLDSKNYYLCIRAVGNKIRGLATKNKKLVTCENCLNRLGDK